MKEKFEIVSRYGLQQKPSVTLSVGSSMISLLIALKFTRTVSTAAVAPTPTSLMPIHLSR